MDGLYIVIRASQMQSDHSTLMINVIDVIRVYRFMLLLWGLFCCYCTCYIQSFSNGKQGVESVIGIRG
jgi:hypothetical protein